MQELIQEFQEIIKTNQKFVVISHNKPDGDTLGSNLALSKVLRRLGKTVTSACHDKVSDTMLFLPNIESIVQDFVLEEFDCVIVVDTAAKHLVSFFEKYPELERTKKPIVTIDHHASNKPFGTLNIIDPKATSTTSLLMQILETLNYEIDSEMATCLLNGIYTDTGSFMHTNTNTLVLKQAAKLTKLGADRHAIQKNNFKKTNYKKLKLMGEVLSNINVTQEGVVQSGVSQFTFKKYNATTDDLSGVADMICSIPNTDYTILFTEEQSGKIKASLRTRKDEVNVAKVAENFGGGGHTKAAGFRVAGRLEKKTSWDFNQLPKN